MRLTRGWTALRKIHLWLGWTTAAWLVLMAGTGTTLLFKTQLKALTAPPCPAAPTRPLPEALQAIDRNFPGRVRLVVPASAELCLHEVIFRDAAGGAYVDPRSLRPLRVWARGGRAIDVVLELHRSLLLRERGKLPVAILAVSTLALVLVGVALALRRPGALSLRLLPLAPTPGALLASHRNLGALLALPLAFMAASGWALTYPKAAQALIAGAVGGALPSPQKPRAQERGPIDWNVVMATAQAAFPGRVPRIVSWPGQPGAAVVVRFRQPGEWAPNGQSAASIAPVSGRLLARRDSRHDGRAARIWTAIYPLHAGKAPPWLGTVVLICVGVGLLSAAVVALSVQVRRETRSRRPAGARQMNGA